MFRRNKMKLTGSVVSKCGFLPIERTVLYTGPLEIKYRVGEKEESIEIAKADSAPIHRSETKIDTTLLRFF